jgi:fibronectin type 3 domain-containing protein
MGIWGNLKSQTSMVSRTVIICMVALLTTALAPSVPAEEAHEVQWTHQFGSSFGTDASGIAVDGSGVYVAGVTNGSLSGQASLGYQDLYLRRYDMDGTLDWTRQFGSSSADNCAAVAVADSGVYVAGNTGSVPPPYLYKYDPDGNQVWAHQFGWCTTTPRDHVLGIAADDSGVYVAGVTGSYVSPTEVAIDAFVSRFTADGLQVWARKFGAPGAETWALDVAVDGSGVYVGGITDGRLLYQSSAGSIDAFVRRYTLDGSEVWTRQFGSPGSEGAFVLEPPSFGVTVDGSGVCVAGNTSGAFPGQTSSGLDDVYVRKFGLNGGTVWTRQFGTTGMDKAYGVTADHSGVYVTGWTSDGLPGHVSSGWNDAFIRVYEPDGDEFLTHQFGTVDHDYGMGVEVHPSGIYASGRTWGTLQGQASTGNIDAFAVKLPTMSPYLNATLGDGHIDLSWRPPYYPDSSITNYSIYRGRTSGNLSYLAKVGNVLTYADASVRAGVTYYYQVRAVNASGEGLRSNEVSATVVPVPSAPQGLRGAPGDRRVDLTWTEADDYGSVITNYRIYRGTTPGDLSLLVEVGDVISYTDTKVTNGVTYYYQVSAVNEHGEGSRAAEASVTPDLLPSAPEDLQAYAHDGEVELIWRVPDLGGPSVTNYTVYRGLTPVILDRLVVVGNVLTYMDTEVTNGTRYHYQISATNRSGEGPWSNVAWATPRPGPSAPRALTATPGERQVQLSWSASTDDDPPITNYRLYRGTTFYQISFLFEVGNVLEYTDTSVTIGKTYYYRVSSVNRYAEGPLSPGVSALLPAEPSTPLSLRASGGDEHIILTWEAPVDDGGSPITSYVIYRGMAVDDLSFLAETGNVLEYTDTRLVNGATYFYKVKAMNAYFEGPFTLPTPGMPKTVPSAPMNLAATSGEGRVDLSWDAPEDNGGSSVIKYYIYRRDATFGDYIFVTEVVEGLAHTDDEVIIGMRCYYQVSAVNVAGEGPLSDEVYASVPMWPSAPQNLTAVEEDGMVKLAWEAPSSDGGKPISGYVVRRSLFFGTPEQVGLSKDLSFTDRNPWKGVLYMYTVSAKNEFYEGGESEAAWMIILLPPNPPDLKDPEVKGTTVVLTWKHEATDGTAPLTGYQVYRRVTSRNWELVATLGNVTTYTDEDLKRGKTYDYYVRATSDIGVSRVSSTVTVDIPVKDEGPGFGLGAVIVALCALATVLLKRRTHSN